MIYTVTCNPALDYILDVPEFQIGVTNRTVAEKLLPGGKGINVSLVLKNLGLESRALGFAAGFTGEEILRRIREMGLSEEFIRLPRGFSRINVKLRSIDGTELNGRGPAVDPESLGAFYEKLSRLTEGDILVLSGSLPEGLLDTAYGDCMGRVREKGVRVILDASGKALERAITERPFLVKPNIHELGALFGRKLSGPEETALYARRLQNLGPENVLVSMGGEGAVLAAADGRIYRCPAPEGKLINSVGAGDSMVAGFLCGFLETGDYVHAFRMGVAAGSASAFSPELATGKEIRELYPRVTCSLL